jgi:hypothetical protein
MIWKKWSLMSFILGRLARAQGFLDPTIVFSRLQHFSKPSEVWVPTELLRSGAVLQARGLINSQAIQHNLDWVWPFWVVRQFDPRDKAFITRAFSMTHINLTHRNWTAIGVPDFMDMPIVDPHGLVTPFFDGWSIDAWIVSAHGHLIPSRMKNVEQKLTFDDGLLISTSAHHAHSALASTAEVLVEEGVPTCFLKFQGRSKVRSWLCVSIRPYNPEGISFINNIRQFGEHQEGWSINSKDSVYLSKKPKRYVLANYAMGDAFLKIEQEIDDRQSIDTADEVSCPAGMATAVAMYELEPEQALEVVVRVPLSATPKQTGSWDSHLAGHCQLKVPDERMQFLYEAALRTLVLHAPEDVYPGPFTYKRFWFRDAAFIIQAMLSVGLVKNMEKILDLFPGRQSPLGYFESQDGEWDSNGQAIWAMQRFSLMTNSPLKKEWLASVIKGAKWIQRKRLPIKADKPDSGLMPAGFSAEHFGPSDLYFWDDFWSIAGLKAASELVAAEHPEAAKEFHIQAGNFMQCVDASLQKAHNPEKNCLPASIHRRLDAGSIGSLAVSYPLQLWPAKDPRPLETALFLMQRYSLDGCFYHEISHSGINAYLSLHIAQVYLRSGHQQFFPIIEAIARLASPTGQWPEAIHPLTLGGCMGDGQHVWAAAEWVLMLRNMFVREEEQERTLILASGIPEKWLKKPGSLSFGPARTIYGLISISITVDDNIHITWEADWYGPPPGIEIRLPGFPPQVVEENKKSHLFDAPINNVVSGKG